MSAPHISDLIARLAHLADYGDLPDYLDCFTEDAVWELSSATLAGAEPDRRVGRADIAEGVHQRRAAGLQGPGSHTRHVITTLEIVTSDESNAEVVSYWHFYVNTVEAPTLAAMGQYNDVLRRCDDGKWRLAQRVITSG
jgi:3-phenylpropionate/cinnamic acid dioxygenase small subunit